MPMGKEIKVRIIMRYNSTEGWAALESGNSILAKGEIGLEYISGSALPKMKIGTGDLSWDNLPYFETSLPKNFTWGNLRGTTLQTSSKTTETLELTKPGFSDTVNIVTLNKNFDKLDQFFTLHEMELNSLGKRISNLVKIAETEFPEGSIEAEILDARSRFGGRDEEGNIIKEPSYDLIGDAMRAIDEDLQLFKERITTMLTGVIPKSLEMNS
jgi:hypothetical protein